MRAPTVSILIALLLAGPAMAQPGKKRPCDCNQFGCRCEDGAVTTGKAPKRSAPTPPPAPGCNLLGGCGPRRPGEPIPQ
jgi:hypothetical protein